jgi:uncharacterized phage protein (TIGR02218 family)
MRPAPSALVAYLADRSNKSAAVIDLYTFALLDGSTLRYAEWTTAISTIGANFPAGSLNAGGPAVFAIGPRFQRSKATFKTGVDPTELDLTIGVGVNDLIGTVNFANACRLGIFDGATVEHDRLWATDSSLATILGAVNWFTGRVAEIDFGRSRVDMKVKSLLNLLSINQFPRRLYGSPCTHLYGGAMCGYDRVNGKNALGVATGVGQFSITAQTGTTQGTINTGSTLASWVSQGTVVGLTGANAGITRTIANTGDGTQIGMFVQYLYPVTVGDTFNVLPGCDHSPPTCDGVMQNLGRFGGFPHIPPPESAV